MRTEKISRKILEEAEKKKSEILSRAEEEARRIREQAEAHAKEIVEKARVQAEELREKEEARLVGLAMIEHRKLLLSARQDAIEEVFSQALAALCRQDRDEYRRRVETLLSYLVGSGDEEIVLPEDDSFIDEDFVNRLNEEHGWQLKLSSERRPIKGGFILRRGKVETNASFEFLFQVARQEMGQEVARLLFE